MSSPTHLLERDQWIPAPLDDVFAFFSDARNLERITPAWLGFRILTPGPIEMAVGARIDYRIRLAGVPVRWRTRIREWKPGEGFVDEQERGPYALWRHSHVFRELPGGVLMTDRVEYRLPLGPLGRLAHALAVRASLAAIFDYRFGCIRQIFPVTLAALLAATAAFTTAAMLVLWLLSLRLRDASIVDIWWGFGFGAIAWVAFVLGAGWRPRALLAACLVSLWGLRLAGHLARRNLGHGEDPRYAAMRSRHGDRFGRVSLVSVFGLQGALQWVISLPVQLAIQASQPAAWTAWDGIGALLVLAGVACEATADWQLARFKADPASRGQVMDRGLWRYSRHPNYFGDALAWWGLGIVALPIAGGSFTLLAPALMTFLLLRVSGVPILERGLARRRPGYAEYVARTAAFVPWFPRRPR